MWLSIIAVAVAASPAGGNSQVVSHLRESVTAISAQLALIAETLQHLPTETSEHDRMMRTLLKLREEHDNLKRRLQQEPEIAESSQINFQHAWKLFFVFDGILGAVLYEQQVKASAEFRGEALWIRRIVTGTCAAVLIVLIQTFFGLISGNKTFNNTVSISILTLRALLLVSALLNDLMRLPRALQSSAVPPPPPSPSDARGSSLDKVRERTGKRLEISTASSLKR